LVSGEHVPAGFGEFAGDGDAGDLAGAVAAEACLGAFIQRLVVDGSGGVLGGLDQRQRR